MAASIAAKSGECAIGPFPLANRAAVCAGDGAKMAERRAARNRRPGAGGWIVAALAARRGAGGMPVVVAARTLA
jgi:hypothetical protein